MLSVKVFVLVFVCVIHFNPNNEGTCTDPINSTRLETKSLSHKYKNGEEVASSIIREEPFKDSEIVSSGPIFNGIDLIVGAICMVISNLFSWVVLSYLGNLAVSKDCLLLYLYRDLIKVALCINCLSEMSVILAYSFGGGIGIPVIGAKTLSFLACNVCLILLLFMNIISALKLYQRKTNILDPPMPWGDDDGKGIKWIRVVATMTSLVFTSTMFGFGIYPKTYYWFIGREIQSVSKVSTEFIIYPVVLMFLIFASIITAFLAKLYKRSNPSPADSGIPKQINYFQKTFCLMLFLTVIIGESNFLSSSNLWTVWKINLAIMQVGVPVLTVLKESQLRQYSYHFLRSKLEELFYYQIYLTPILLFLFMNGTLYLIYDYFDI